MWEYSGARWKLIYEKTWSRTCQTFLRVGYNATHIYDHASLGLCLLYKAVEVESQLPAERSDHAFDQFRFVLAQPVRGKDMNIFVKSKSMVTEKDVTIFIYRRPTLYLVQIAVDFLKSL